VEEEDEEFEEEFVGSVDPSILHFLLASGDRISSKQARALRTHFACLMKSQRAEMRQGCHV
jgi:hypothetical protein